MLQVSVDIMITMLQVRCPEQARKIQLYDLIADPGVMIVEIMIVLGRPWEPGMIAKIF